MRKVKRCLIDELALHSGKNVMIGAKSSFFYIGPSEEAISDIGTLSLLNKYCVAMYNQKRLPKSALNARIDDVGKREVVESFRRISAYDGCEVAIIIAGREFGVFWTRDEYLEGKKAILDELARLKAEK